MADVFISYRKADRAKAEALAKALKIENLDVWWDTALETGQTFDEKIQAALEQAKAVIVIWSKESVKSDWVRAESSIGRERGILVPVMVQPVNIPVPFNLIHTADLIGWHGDRAHPGYRDVVKQVKTLAGKTSVKPLKPPPNRAIRALWRTIAVVARRRRHRRQRLGLPPVGSAAHRRPRRRSKEASRGKTRGLARQARAPRPRQPAISTPAAASEIAVRLFKQDTASPTRRRGREGRSRVPRSQMRRRSLDAGR